MKVGAFLLFAVSLLCAERVRVSEQSITVPRPAEPVSPIPAFGAGYPYPARPNEMTNKSARVIVLENTILSCRILPDLGGRLQGCTDQRNHRELPGAVVESYGALFPADFAFSTNDDGSASVTTGAVDRVSGLRWRMQFTLRPDSDVLQRRVTISNPARAPVSFGVGGQRQMLGPEQARSFMDQMPSLMPGLKAADTATGSEQDFLRAGEQAELQGDAEGALAAYGRGLLKAPNSAPLLLAEGRLAVAHLRFEQAARDLASVHGYYRGAALVGEDNDAAAEPELRRALHDAQTGAAAALELGGVLARRGDFAGAVAQFHAACSANPDAIRACDLEIAAFRRERRLDAARARARSLRARAPEDPFLRAEAIRLGGSDRDRSASAKGDGALDITADYLFLGAYDDALALLARAEPNPLVVYYRASAESSSGCRRRLT